MAHIFILFYTDIHVFSFAVVRLYINMIKTFSLRKKIILGFLLVLIPSSLVGFLAIRSLNNISEPLQKDIPGSIASLRTATQLDSLEQVIHYYDEVLTQSTRNYAFTGNNKWKERYRVNAPKLDTAIRQAISLGDKKDKVFFSSINTANIALVKMEETSLDLVDAGKKTEAIVILESTPYAEEKTAYQNGLDNYTARHATQYELANSSSLLTLNTATQKIKTQTASDKNIIIAVIVASTGLFLLWGIVFSFLLTEPIQKLTTTALSIAGGNESERSDIRSNDEIGTMAEAFNQMADNLQKSKMNIEEQVKERTADLEKLNNFMTGRELKMIELKKEIAELKK